jgi:hypothetical protein
VAALVPVRDPDHPVAQHPVERADAGFERGAVLGGDDLFDQVVDHRIGEA